MTGPARILVAGVGPAAWPWPCRPMTTAPMSGSSMSRPSTPTGDWLRRPASSGGCAITFRSQGVVKQRDQAHIGWYQGAWVGVPRGGRMPG
jgi:hypothetical protein